MKENSSNAQFAAITVSSNNHEYKKVLAYLKKKRLYYIKIKLRQIFESLAGWLIMYLMQEKTWSRL